MSETEIAVGRKFRVRRTLGVVSSSNSTVYFGEGSIISLVNSNTKECKMEFSYGENGETFELKFNRIRNNIDLHYESFGVIYCVAKEIYDLDWYYRQKIQSIIIKYEDYYKNNPYELNKHLVQFLEKLKVQKIVKDIIE